MPIGRFRIVIASMRLAFARSKPCIGTVLAGFRWNVACQSELVRLTAGNEKACFIAFATAALCTGAAQAQSQPSRLAQDLVCVWKASIAIMVGIATAIGATAATSTVIGIRW
jgi:hypothetical protein